MSETSIVLRLVTGTPAELEVIDAIARDSFEDAGFSAAKELERPWARVWIARPEGEGSLPNAFLVAWHVADELHILNIATVPAMRRRGLGTALMTVALEYAAEGGVRLILLEVRRSNQDARRFYKKLGFSVMGVRAGYYADNGEDAIEMTLELDPATGRVVPGKDEIRIDV
jgi:ribosomal-protein-alanine N-acetyltransferase